MREEDTWIPQTPLPPPPSPLERFVSNNVMAV